MASTKRTFTLYPAIFEKNIGALNLEEQRSLENAKVAIIGCGGVGGGAFEQLVRSGVGSITVVDKDHFEISNLNRQVLSDLNNLNERKVSIAKNFAMSINPEIKIKSIADEFDEKNALKILKKADADVVIDGLDNIFSRIVLSRTAKRLGIPYVFGAAEKRKGLSTIFLPSSKTYEETFMIQALKEKKENREKLKCRGCESVLGVVANMIGCFEALQAINFVLNKKVVVAPLFLHIDLDERTPIWIGKL